MSSLFTLRSFGLALLLQLIAGMTGFAWAPAVAALVSTLLMLRRGLRTSYFTEAFVAGALAPAIQLTGPALFGAPIRAFADMLGGVFQLPGWGVLVLACLLPALQAGGAAGALAAFVTSRSRPTPPTRA